MAMTNLNKVAKQLEKVVENTRPKDRNLAEEQIEVSTRRYYYDAVPGNAIVVPANEVWSDVSFYVFLGVGSTGYLWLEYRPPETLAGGGQYLRYFAQTPAACLAASYHVFTDAITSVADVDFLASGVHFYQIPIPKMRHLPGTYFEMSLQNVGIFEMVLTYTKQKYDVVRT